MTNPFPALGPELIVGLAALVGFVVALIIGIAVGGRGGRAAREESVKLHASLRRLETKSRENQRLVQKLRQEKGPVASLALSLSGVVRELNRSQIDPAKVPTLIMRLASSIFQPGKILFYRMQTVRGAAGVRKELLLTNHHGLTIDPREIGRIALGQGKIGWAAQHRLDMTKEDWMNLARTEGLRVDPNHPSLDLEIIGPLVYQARDKEQVLGVLCIGDAKSHPENEKLMFQMVTNLGSLAMVNAMSVSALSEQANHDGLTGLLNKRFFLNELSETIVAAEKSAQSLALFIFDIDHFKTYNDTNGHPAGDELLRSLAALIRQNLRPNDRCCRYGGEEFLILMNLTEADAAFTAAERLRQVIEAEPFEHQQNQPGEVLTISGGVSVFPLDGANQEELIEAADKALYESKRAGRNRVTRARSTGLGGDDHDAGPVAVPMPRTDTVLR